MVLPEELCLSPCLGVAAKRPQLVGKLTNDLVYERIAPSVLEELRQRNPKTPKGTRKHHHHHQWLTRDFGHPRLREHLWAIIALMKVAPNWRRFKDMLNRALPKYPKYPTLFDGQEQ
ncbi:MAG: hypothetical protein ISS70_07395 [Phycisphaerae bacterium]|nr:hypothetical protein [Phycisphaerae bacterium]